MCVSCFVFFFFDCVSSWASLFRRACLLLVARISCWDSARARFRVSRPGSTPQGIPRPEHRWEFSMHGPGVERQRGNVVGTKISSARSGVSSFPRRRRRKKGKIWGQTIVQPLCPRPRRERKSRRWGVPLHRAISASQQAKRRNAGARKERVRRMGGRRMGTATIWTSRRAGAFAAERIECTERA